MSSSKSHKMEKAPEMCFGRASYSCCVSFISCILYDINVTVGELMVKGEMQNVLESCPPCVLLHDVQ